MEVELDIIIDKKDIEHLKTFCEKAMKGRISDLEWREYQLNALFDNTQTLKMDGHREHGYNSITYIFTSRMLLGCMEDVSFETHLGRVTHVTSKIHIENSKAKATVRVLDTHQGKILRTILEDGIDIRIIPRWLPNKQIYRLDI